MSFSWQETLMREYQRVGEPHGSGWEGCCRWALDRVASARMAGLPVTSVKVTQEWEQDVEPIAETFRWAGQSFYEGQVVYRDGVSLKILGHARGQGDSVMVMREIGGMGASTHRVISVDWISVDVRDSTPLWLKKDPSDNARQKRDAE